MEQITPLGWLGIAFLVLITVGVNLMMVSLLRSREKMDDLGKHLRDRKPPVTVRMLQQIRESARDPFKADRDRINELSNLVSTLPGKDATESEKENAGKGENPH